MRACFPTADSSVGTGGRKNYVLERAASVRFFFIEAHLRNININLQGIKAQRQT
jgi:hypothetical protein